MWSMVLVSFIVNSLPFDYVYDLFSWLIIFFYSSMEERYIQVKWHHGGLFVSEGGLKYVSGVAMIKNMDVDRLSVPELI